MCLLNVIGQFMITWLHIYAMFPGGEQVKNCCPPQMRQKLCILMQHRFSNLSNTEIQLLIEKKDSENTQKEQRMLWQRFWHFVTKFRQTNPR